MIGLAHPFIALGAQFSLFGLFGNWWLGVIASAFFFGREITQAEYRWIAAYGSGLRANMPWWGAFDPRVWNLHSLTDCLLPLLLTAAIAGIAS
ncbi:MAG: hypothetical protein J7498_05545 [Sphingobium sp.]|nr:hypothetical protein [Sphingobium sp.]